MQPNRQQRRSKLLRQIDEKLTAPKPNTKSRRKAIAQSTARTKQESNRQNAQKSTGPKSTAGKATASSNSLKHGFFAQVENLHPHDSPLYQSTLADLRLGLQPDGPVEEMLVRELATFSTRLQRLEAVEYALIAGNTQSDPADSRAIAAAFETASTQLEALQRAETHLRRSYHRTWDRLERLQKERLKMPLDEMLKRSHHWLTTEAQRNNQPQNLPSRHPAIDEKGTLITYPKNHPMHRPKEDDEPLIPEHDHPEIDLEPEEDLKPQP